MQTLEDLTALYSPYDTEYAQVMSGPYEDLSYHGDDCKVIAAIKDNKIDGFWRPMVAAGKDSELKLEIVRLWEISRKITYMDFLIDGKLSVISQFLLRHGYTARPHYTQIIDLTRINLAWTDVRKSYKSIINGGLGATKPVIFAMFHRLAEHLKPGVRCSESWYIQEKMVKANRAFCISDGAEPMPGAVVLIYHNHRTAYYAGARSTIDSHAVMWRAILTAYNLGCKTLEMGEQVFKGDPKLINISKFKRGFGGATHTRLILEPK